METTPWFQRYFETDDYEEFNLEVLGPEVSSEQVSRAIHWLGLRSEHRVLDLCCGPGRHTLELRRRGFQAVGLDLSPYQLAKALRRRGPAPGAPPFVRADARQVPLASGTVDAVLSLFNSFGYFDEEGNSAVLREVHRVLRPGGKLLLEVLNRDAFLMHQSERTWDEVPSGLVLQEIEYQVRTSQIRTTWTYVRSAGSTDSFVTLNRLYSAHELVSLCQAAGFEVLDLSDGTVKGYFSWRHSHGLAVVARRRDT